MASQRTRKVEVLGVVSRFIAILAAIALLTLLFAPAVLAQVAQTAKPNPASAQRSRQKASFNSSDSSLFLPVVTYDSGGIGPVALAVGDLNGDGHPDVVVANYCAATSCDGGIVSVLLGNGDGTFQTPVSYSTGGSNPWSVAIGDVNGDGYPDLVVANLCQSSTNCNNGTIAVLLGNGDGTFRAPTIFNAGGYSNFSVVIGDVNGDRIPDLVVGNYLQCITCTEGAVSVFLGNGDGTFRAPVSYSSAGYEVYSVAMGDLSGNGKTDLVVTNNCQSSTACPGPGGLSVLMGNGDGTFQPAVPYSSGGYWGPDAVVIVDVNGDGIPDLVASNYCQSGSNCPGPGDVAVLIGKGDGTFHPPVSYDSGGYKVFLVAVGDVNGDGHPDLVVANECDSASCNHGVAGVLLGNGDGTFQAAQTYSSGGSIPYAVVVADVNGDGRPDVLMANSASNTVGVLLNSAQTPTNSSVTSPLNPSVYGQAVTFNVQVTSNWGTPAGTVQILYGATVVGTGTLVNGSVSIPVSTLPAGSDSITASYLGQAGFVPSKSAPLTQTVTVATTTTSLVSSLNPAGTGQSVTLTATVASQNGGAATGSVVFSSGSQTLGTASLVGNVAALTTSFSAPGTYLISAQYTGDGNNTGSTSAALSEKILAATTTTTLTSSPNPSDYGQAVTFTATVTVNPPGSGTPTGTVAFYDGAILLGSVALPASGQAMYTTSALSVGSHSITAIYSGDTNFPGSTSPVLIQQVIAPAVTLSKHALSFGNQVINTTSAAKTVLLTNSGNATLAISSITPSANFAVSSTTCGATLAPRKQCTVYVTFTPPMLGQLTGTLTFTDNALNSPQAMALSGIGVEPAVLTPAKTIYNAQAVGAPSAPKTFTLTNNQTLALNSIVISTTGDFAMSSTTCTTSLAAKSKCTIEVTFTPTVLGTRTGQLSVSDDAVNSPQMAALSGSGAHPAMLDPASADYGYYAVGPPGVPITFTLTNHQSVTLNNIVISLPGGFVLSSTTCATNLAAKSKCTINVAFSPGRLGLFKGHLSVSDDASNSPQTSYLTGIGAP